MTQAHNTFSGGQLCFLQYSPHKICIGIGIQPSKSYCDVPGPPYLSKTGPVYGTFLFLNFWVVYQYYIII